MKRALIALLWVALAACGGGDPEDTDEDRPANIPAPPCSASGACR